tara:strand:- start:707 stop:1960 length:1254 start_codon:yes stop_codon:yes gene_type:complete
MIDPQLLKTNVEVIKENLKKRDLKIDLEILTRLDEERRAIKFESEKLRSEQKKLGKEIATSEGDQKNKLLNKAEKLSEKVKQLSDENQKKDEQFFNEWIKIPNIVDPSSPVGKTDEDNKELKKVGTPKDIKGPLSHLNIGENLGLINVEKASSVSGSRFSYLFGDLVKIQFNLVSFAMNKLSEKGFNPTIPPVLVRENALYGTGFFPDDSDQVYEIPNDDLFLVGTSEVSLAALHSDEIVSYDSLPIRYAGYSTCFRREAGTYGKDTSGIFRVHQFDKVEMFSFCSPEKSDEEHEFILSIEEEILQELEIPYRVVDVCTGDLGSSAAKKYDIEAWIPSQEQYREVTSCSNTTDFQARRLNIRTKIDKNSTLLHTLNGTAIAVGRILIALLENNQTKDGNVEFSENLSKILGINKLSK